MNINKNKLIERMFDKYNYCLKKIDCEDLSDDLISIVNESNIFLTPLQEWINGKRVFTDVRINDFSLVELAFKLDSTNPNIPIAVLVLWLESQENAAYHGLAAVAEYDCVANPQIILWAKCEVAIFSDEKWFFMLNDQEDDELKKYQAWQILLLNPTLIIQVAYEHPNNTSLILQNDGSYLISVYEEEG